MNNVKAMSHFFSQNLNAPLVNVQWSWGAENEKGVYLRIWDEEVKSKCGVVYINDPLDKRLGQKERYRHIKTIQQGKPGYVVVITAGHVSDSGTWRIDAYDECIYRILRLNTNEKGDIFADVDFDNPIYPKTIGQEIDIDRMLTAASKVPSSMIKLERAMSNYGWQPIGLSDCGDKITLMSRNGRQMAKLIISSSDWIRLQKRA